MYKPIQIKPKYDQTYVERPINHYLILFYKNWPRDARFGKDKITLCSFVKGHLFQCRKPSNIAHLLLNY